MIYNIRRELKKLYSAFLLWKKYFLLKIKHRKSKIKKFRNIHKGKTIFCIGAGPSLNKEDLSYLDNQIIIFTNSTFKSSKKYWIVQDQNRLNELKNISRKEFNASFRSFHTLINTNIGSISNDDILLLPEIIFSNEKSILVPFVIETGIKFSTELSKKVCLAGNSVIFTAIQIASYMGARRIVLLGVDMNYGSNIVEAYFDGKEGDTRAFWKIDYELHSKGAFIAYDKFLKSLNKELINASCETKEDVLVKMPLYQISKLI